MSVIRSANINLVGFILYPGTDEIIPPVLVETELRNGNNMNIETGAGLISFERFIRFFFLGPPRPGNFNFDRIA